MSIEKTIIERMKKLPEKKREQILKYLESVIDTGQHDTSELTLAPDEMWRIPIQEEEISPALKKAVLAYEDKHFYFHFGVNPISVIRALAANIKAGEVVQGASTITMQVARLSNPKSTGRSGWSR